MTKFVVKDSGKREEFEGGMVRDTTINKIGWHRVADGPMLKRWAEHLTRGEVKYPDTKPGMPNWTLARGTREYERFRQSAFRHFMQWYLGETDEDHAAAVFFNINGAEYVKGATPTRPEKDETGTKWKDDGKVAPPDWAPDPIDLPGYDSGKACWPGF